MRILKGKKIYTVWEVNALARQTLEQMSFWVEGEISSLKKNPNWSFYYLDLKDEKAMLPCVADSFLLKEFNESAVGQQILVFGVLNLYEALGKYQLRIYSIEEIGEGLLQKQLEYLVKKLKAEGLFDAGYKKEIPKYPKRVCLVTSYGSNAWGDFKVHTVDQFPLIELYTADVRVQGLNSVDLLVKVLPKVDSQRFDVIVVTRGGGSVEDLAAFNDEQVARIIFKMKTPVVVAIGHEANESLAEWVADKRASTPTDAASLITEGYKNLVFNLENLKQRLKAAVFFYFSANFQRLDYIHLKIQQAKVNLKESLYRLNTIRQLLERDGENLIVSMVKKLNNLNSKMTENLRDIVKKQGQKLTELNHLIVLLSPKSILGRGYSITTDRRGKILRSINAVVVGETVGVKLADGSFISKVKSKREI